MKPAQSKPGQRQDTQKAKKRLSGDKRSHTCRVCGRSSKTSYCSDDCRLVGKVLETRSRRPLKDHICECKWCGKVFKVGRPRRPIPSRGSVKGG